MNLTIKTFYELSVDELYEILKSRNEIFLLEQNIVCQDLDDMDKESLHCFFEENGRVKAYLRAYNTGEGTVMVGRVLTLEHKKGLGSLLMTKSLEKIKKHFNCTKVRVHAQKQAQLFYEKMGFKTVFGEFLEEGVVHITMEREI